MKDIAVELTTCSLFRDVPETLLREQVLPRGTVRVIPKGQYLIFPQERLDYFGVVLRGRIYMMHIFQDGGCSISDVLERREVFGADLMCTRSRVSPYHAMTAEETEMIFFPVEMVLQTGQLEESVRQRMIGKLLMLLSHDNMRKEYRLAILARKGLRDRIVTYLTMQANKRHTDTFVVPFSRDEMASFLCVNRSALSHELSLMQEEGLISFHKNRFTLHGWQDADVHSFNPERLGRTE